MINSGIFGTGTNLNQRLVKNYSELAKLVKHFKGIGLKIVVTSGTYDMLHIGHMEYLEKAKGLGDVLIVGVDSDEKVKARKGPDRPIYPESERVLALAHLRHVDVLFVKHSKDSKHRMLKVIHPDILVISETTNHRKQWVKGMKKLCGKIVCLPPQASTSTSAKIRKLHTGGAMAIAENLIPDIAKLIQGRLNEIINGKRKVAK